MSYDFTQFKKSLASVEEWIKKEYSGIRTGQANPAILDGIKVDNFGALVPIMQIASISTEGSRSLRISPWDNSQIKDIEKAISLANLGLSTSTDERGVRVNFPELTTESRSQLVKIAKDKLEEAKKQIRSHRDDIMKDIQSKEKKGSLGKDESFRFQKDTQKFVDEANTKLENHFNKKEKEITS